jgi:hypothetical protein
VSHDPDHLRELPAGHDDPTSATYVAPDLRDFYVRVELTPQALDTAIRHRKAREDHQEDQRAFERQAAEKRRRNPDAFREWYRMRTKPTDPDDPNGPRVLSRYGLSMLDDRPQDTDRGTLSSRRVLTPAQINDETHQLILRTARQHADAVKAAPALEAARARRETCAVCGIRHSLDVRPEHLIPGTSQTVLACRDCAQVVPLLAALTAPVGEATRLELAAAWLDEHHAADPGPSDALAARVADWLDSEGAEPFPLAVDAGTTAAQPTGGVLARLRGHDTAPTGEPNPAGTPDASGPEAGTDAPPALGRRRIFGGGSARPKG